MIQNIRLLMISLLSGAIAGFVIGGIGGRVAMRVVADSVNKFPELTFATLTVLFIGTLLGVTGGLPYFVIRKLAPGSTLVRIIALSLCVFAVESVTFFPNNPTMNWLSRRNWVAFSFRFCSPHTASAYP